jgi:hypothetical protein
MSYYETVFYKFCLGHLVYTCIADLIKISYFWGQSVMHVM